jgi:hypothetical protein
MNDVRDLILEDIIMEKHAKETGQTFHSKLKSTIKNVDREVRFGRGGGGWIEF